MEDDDEFGDLYADALPPASAASEPPLPPRSEINDEDGDGGPGRVFLGAPFGSPLSPLSYRLPAKFVVLDAQEGGDVDRVLGQGPASEEQPLDWSDGEEEGLAPRVSGGRVAGLSPRQGGMFGDLKEVEVAAGLGEAPHAEVGEDEEGIGVAEDVGASARGREAVVTPDVWSGTVDLDQEPAIPGLSVACVPSGALDDDERGDGKVSRSGDWDSDSEDDLQIVLNDERGDGKVSRSDDWDSDSEDDLQIVLNDDNVGLANGNRNVGAGVEDDDDEDGEGDLVIITDEVQQHPHPHHLHGMKEQEWDEESMHQPLDGERNETLDVTRGNGEVGSVPLSKIGYHRQQHSPFKYIRPDAAGLPGGSATGTGDTSGQFRPPLTMGLMTGRGRGTQKSFHSGYGFVHWSNGTSACAYGGGLEFTLPSHKTIFEIDLDDFEEKPWRLPGVDVSDFFNFGLNEEKWRFFCKQLEQLRLEATMQSKICVYESGRSEQGYDPDLPPELAAATGLHVISAESIHCGKVDREQADLVGQGRGARPQMPVGRAIQVESSFSERLPSIDTRPPRLRDSDVIIEIVLQDSVDVCSGISVQQPCEPQGQDVGGDYETEDDDKHADSWHICHFSPACSGGKRELMKRKESPRTVGFIDNSAPEGNCVLPFPPDSSSRYLPSSQSQAPAIAGDHYVAPRAARRTQSNASAECSNDANSSQSIKLQIYDGQKERLGDRMEDEGVMQISPVVPLETAAEVKLEQGNDEQSDLLALDEDAETEKEEIASDLHPVGESHADDDPCHTVKKQKLSSQVEQLAFQDDGVDSRATHSDNSRVESGSSKDHLKRQEGSEDEIMQSGRTSQIRDPTGHHFEEKQSSKQHKLSSQVEQLAFQDDGDDSRPTHSDNSRVESGSSKEHLKREEGSEEEIMRGGRTSRIRDSTRHHFEEKQSSKRRDGHGRDGGHDVDRSCDTSKGKQDIYQSCVHREWDSTRNEAFESGKERDDSFGRKGKDEDRKRGHDDEIGSRNRSGRVRASERKGKDVDLHSRKLIGDSDWKGRHDRDGAPRQRERDDISIRHEKFDDIHVKRKRDEEQLRREKVAKEGVLHVHKVMDGTTHSKREKDNGANTRGREEQASVRDKVENHFTKHRGDNLRHREREDRRKLNEDMHTHKRRGEEHTIHRIGRVLVNKSIGGVDRVNSVSKSFSLDDYPPKDKRRHGEHKRGDHVKEYTHSQHKTRQKVRPHENQSSKRGKTLKNERFSSHSDHALAASDSQQMCRERHRENPKKNKEMKGVETRCLAAGKSKHEDQRHRLNEKINAEGPNEQDCSKTSSALLLKKGHHLADKPDAQEQRHFPGSRAEDDVASDDDDGNQNVRRGRSKLERWTSHKERDYGRE